MAWILERPRKDGTTAYMAMVVIKRDGKIVHRESKTFDAERKALAWGARREEDLTTPASLADALANHTNPKLADVIGQYVKESRRAIGRTKAQVLQAIQRDPIAQMRCNRITSKELIAFAQRIGAKAKPQTVANYLSHLGAVFAIARPAWGYPLDRQALADAFTVAKRLGITSKGRERSRRPTRQELDAIMLHFTRIRARRPSTAPMAAIVAFAIFSTRRQEEITRLLWADLDERHSRILVRDMKDPGDKEGNDQWLTLPPEALAIAAGPP